MTPLLGLGLVGGLGAIARVLLDGAISERAGGQLPAGTFALQSDGYIAAASAQEHGLKQAPQSRNFPAIRQLRAQGLGAEADRLEPLG